MKRKRFIKLQMSRGTQRNTANEMAKQCRKLEWSYSYCYKHPIAFSIIIGCKQAVCDLKMSYKQQKNNFVKLNKAYQKFSNQLKELKQKYQEQQKEYIKELQDGVNYYGCGAVPRTNQEN